MLKEDTFNIFVGGSGELQYLHKEVFDLDPFGRRDVTRASDVEFDDVNQEWIATLNDGTEIARDKSRDAVLRIEREVIDRMLANGEAIPGV